MELRKHRDELIALLAVCALLGHVVLRFLFSQPPSITNPPLFIALLIGGGLLVLDLGKRALARDFGSDLLAGLSIIVAILLGEYLAGTLVVLMLSGGTALEKYAVRKASGALDALARRTPTTAHRETNGVLVDVAVAEIQIGDRIAVYPHEVCPVDGVVVDGRSRMNEAYLTGEPFEISKSSGAEVISGALNGDGLLTIRATRRSADSRHAKIMRVMQDSAQKRPRIRRLADQLGAYYTPLAVVIAAVAWAISGDPTRFLAVLVVATPCPLLIAIPVALIGTISLAARRSIVIRDPACLELIDSCRTIILDKTGTLTQGKPSLTNIHVAPGQNPDEILALAATLEQYSKHPLAGAVIREADNRKVSLREASDISEPPGFGLRGTVDGRQVAITGRKHVADQQGLPPQTGGLECVILLDEKYAGTLVFHDRPLTESGAFVRHLRSRHKFAKIMIVSGDRESEVRHLADQVGITDIYAEQTPEQKVEITRAETAKAPTLFMGDGINDAPALLAATVGIAFGPQNDVASEAAGAVVLESSLVRVDELFHLSRRMRRIALESAIGGMLLSVCGMFFAAAGLLPPVAGALVQEAIDLAAIMNALRASFAPSNLTDVDSV